MLKKHYLALSLKTLTSRIPTIFLTLLILFAVACTQTVVTSTPTPSSIPQPTAITLASPQPSATATPTLDPSLLPLSLTPTFTPTLSPTPMPTPFPSATPFPLPLLPMTPFPTVTPDYFVYATKQIFISLVGCCGDGGANTDDVYGRDTPFLIIYSDGQMIIREGDFRQYTFVESQLTPSEMCQLRQQIASTGFLEPHTEFFIQRDESAGVGQLSVQVEDTYYSFYGGDVQYLVDDLASGYELIRDYRPIAPFVSYTPQYLVLWVEEAEPDETESITLWPAQLPLLSELWKNPEEPTVFVEGEWVVPIFDLFERRLASKYFQEGDIVYRIIARPLLPHETPYHYPVYPTWPLDYVPVLSCEGEASFISPLIPTATPTLTSLATQLTGVGRLLFVAGQYNDREIYVMEADGSNRIRLTNNRVPDVEPVWSPDGREIAFVSERDGDQEIFVMNADGSNVRQLTYNDVDDYSPFWSPDGLFIAFVSDRVGGWSKSEIYVMTPDGLGQQRVTFNELRDLYPAWAPDNNTIIYVKELDFNNNSSLYTLNLDQPALNEEEWSFQNRRIPRPAWSPDGSQLAVIETVYGSISVIHTFNASGAEQQAFSIPFEFPTSLDWSADGRFIFFSAREPNIGENQIIYSMDQPYYGDYDLFALDVTTGEIIQITFTQQDESMLAVWP